MRNEVVFTPGRSEPESFNRCDYCNIKEHTSTMGITSVDPKYEDMWFCSTFCLHTKKHSNKPFKKQQRKKKHN